MNKRLIALLSIIIIVFTLIACENKQTDGSFVSHDTKVVFINVGRADSAFIMIDGHSFLIDTGEAESTPAIFGVLGKLGVDALDAVFITHSHDDHIGGLEGVAKNFTIDKLYSSEISIPNKDGENKIAKKADKLSLTHEYIGAGTRIDIAEDAYFSVLAPLSLDNEEENNNSLVLMLYVNGKKLLFTGDMQFPEETALLKTRTDISADVLKVGNHGNPDATSQSFARAVSPEYVVISTDTVIDGNSANKRVQALFSGKKIFITEDSSLGFLFTVEQDGSIAVENLLSSESSSAKITLSANYSSQTAILQNDSASDIDISRYYIYSNNGAEVFRFPVGTVLPSKGSITVGNKEGYDFMWDENKIWKKNQADMAILFDSNGGLVCTFTVNPD